MIRDKYRAIPLPITPPELPYRRRLVRQSAHSVRYLLEEMLVDLRETGIHLFEVFGPPVREGASALARAASHPPLVRWLAIWSALLFITCY